MPVKPESKIGDNKKSKFAGKSKTLERENCLGKKDRKKKRKQRWWEPPRETA